MGGKSGGGSEAKLARQEEQARQARIREGTARINTIFSGGKAGVGQLESGAVYDPNQTYYKADGSVWTPGGTAGSFGSKAGGSTGPSSYGGKAGGSSGFDDALKSGLYTGVGDVPGQFGDSFFDKQRDNYIAYATPQLEDQRADANKEMVFALDRGGQLSGSSRASLAGDLQKKYELQRQKVADDALNYRTQAMTNVEGARTDLINTLNATGDAEGAATSAIARASALSQPANYSPITGLFADFTGALGTQAAAERAHTYGAPKPTYNTGLFGTPRGAVQVSP